MLLINYIADPARRAKLADDIGTSPQYLWQMATGWNGKRPSRLMAEAIELRTASVVTKQSLRPDIWPELAPRSRKRAA